MIEKFFLFINDYGWVDCLDSYPFTAGPVPKVLVVQNQEEHDYCAGLAFVYGHMPEILIKEPGYIPQQDSHFFREVMATTELDY